MPMVQDSAGASLATPDRDGVSGHVGVAERREGPRRRMPARVALSPLGSSSTQQCQTDDISEGGLYVRIPSDGKLAVGQRCEVSFLPEQPDELSAVAGAACYGTVVRTEVVDDPSDPRIGAGLRFDQPLYL